MSSSSLELINEMVRAGAGAGKTTNLVQKVIDLVSDFRKNEERFPRLVVTTFTRKATQELRDRLVVKACELKNLELLEFFSSRSRLHISTIHGVLTQFCRNYGHLWGLDANFTIMGAPETERLQKQILRRLLVDSANGQELLETFTFSQLCQVCVAFHEAQAANPNIQPVSERDLGEIAQRKWRALGVQMNEIASEVLRESSDEKFIEFAKVMVGCSQILSVIPTAESFASLCAAAEGLSPKPRFNAKKPQISEDLKVRMHEVVDETKELLADECINPVNFPAYVEQTKRLFSVAEPFSRLLDESKIQAGKLAMSDLELLALKAVRQYPGLAQAFAADWDYWLIDEYQDTSPLQVELLTELIGDKASYAVGDPQQSIYLFRGARVEVFEKREAKVIREGGRQTFLSKNYRSEPGLLLFLNDFFAGLKSSFSPMLPRELQSGQPSLVATFYRASRGEAERGREDEYRGISAHIEKLLARPGVRFSDICILARTNRTLGDLAQFLKQQGYPTHVHAAKGFFERREVRDVLALLKFLVNPHDNFNLLLLLRSPWCRISDSVLANWAAEMRASLWDFVRQKSEAEHPFVIRELRRLQELAQHFGFAHALERGVIEFGLVDFSSHHDATGRRESNIWKLLNRLRLDEAAPGFRVLDFVSQSFVDLSEASGNEEGDAVTAVEPDCINLMTVHASKGLQRQHVILPHCDQAPQISRPDIFACSEGDGLCSVSVALGSEDRLQTSLHGKQWAECMRERELEELDRVLYVALTRAQQSVFISWTGNPARNSWADRWQWPTHEAGDFVHANHYVAQVIHGPTEATVQNRRGVRQTEIRPLCGLAPKVTALGTFSVTDLLETQLSDFGAGSSAKTTDLAQRVRRATDGVHIHRLMEGLRYQPQMDWERAARQWFAGQASTFLRARDYILGLSSPPMSLLLAQGEVEWGFQLRTSGGILEGQIDLWGVDPDTNTVWVVDYKSGSSRYQEKAQSQLSIYALALARLGVGSRIKMAAIFPLHQEVHISDYPGEAEVLKIWPQLQSPI